MPLQLENIRLPAWLLPPAWPRVSDQPRLADLSIDAGRVQAVTPATGQGNGLDCKGTLVLPGLLEAHAHLDKTLTRARLGRIAPGLLGAIAATQADRSRWSEDDLRQRACRALQQAQAHGVTHLRSHVDWWSPEAPQAWTVLRELAQDMPWPLERVALVPLPLFEDAGLARRIANAVARHCEAPGAVLGAFIHSSNFSLQSVHNLLACAADLGLPLDLHIDEELSVTACGLATVARLARASAFPTQIICSHACALASQSDAVARQTLDLVARAPITLLALPATNLYLQDAVPERTPRLRGLTLLKEARQRDIPLLIGSDNVQDAFNPIGNYDPLASLQLAAWVAQLDDVFDIWSQSICRVDWLGRPQATPTLSGQSANLTLLHTTDPWTWPAERERSLLRGEQLPANYLTYLRSLP
jgi:cytosine deaminase